MFFVYVLRSRKDNKRYIGQTANLDARFSEHCSGLVKSTKNRRPLDLIYFEEFETRKDAMDREKFFKSGKGREFLNSIEMQAKDCNPPQAGESDRRLLP